jgi:hypothetical protein
MISAVFGRSGETRTRGIQLPNCSLMFQQLCLMRFSGVCYARGSSLALSGGSVSTEKYLRLGLVVGKNSAY